MNKKEKATKKSTNVPTDCSDCGKGCAGSEKSGKTMRTSGKAKA